MQHLLSLGELHLVVLDDLEVVPPGVEEVETAAGANRDASRLESAPCRLLVVDNEPEVTGAVRGAERPSMSARNWSPMSMNAAPFARPRSVNSKKRP